MESLQFLLESLEKFWQKNGSANFDEVEVKKKIRDFVTAILDSGAIPNDRDNNDAGRANVAARDGDYSTDSSRSPDVTEDVENSSDAASAAPAPAAATSAAPTPDLPPNLASQLASTSPLQLYCLKDMITLQNPEVFPNVPVILGAFRAAYHDAGKVGALLVTDALLADETRRHGRLGKAADEAERVVDRLEEEESLLEASEAPFVKAIVHKTFGFCLNRLDKWKYKAEDEKRMRLATTYLDEFRLHNTSSLSDSVYYYQRISVLRQRSFQSSRARGRPPDVTAVAALRVFKEWDVFLEELTEIFGVHEIVAFAYKERGNCCLDFKRDADAASSFRSAMANRRPGNDNLRVAKILQQWGIALMNLNDHSAFEKFDEALDICEGRDEVLADSVRKYIEEAEKILK